MLFLFYKGPGCKVLAAPDTLEYQFNRGVLVLHFTIQGKVQYFMFLWFNLFLFTKWLQVNKGSQVALIWYQTCVTVSATFLFWNSHKMVSKVLKEDNKNF